ncbi:CARDB domain-containing protein [Cystobacter fuscus]|uniref:CARDB domain-containing protein n=1 Tax=Cystobacter fuscus TaxID=43 RepID=UPI0037C0E2BA
MKASLGALSLMALLGCQTPEPSAAGASEAASPLVTGPDFVVTELSGPSSVLPGDLFEVTATVCNQGGQGGSTQAELFLSADTVFSAQTDLPRGQLYLPYLAAGQCSRQTTRMSAQVPTNGVWYVGARLDPLGDENPGNNTRFSAPVGIGFLADFVVTSVTGPASVEPGQRLTARVTVCNHGTRSESTQVALLLSEDADIRLPSPSAPSKDSFVGEALVPWLAPSQCATVSISGDIYPPPTNTPNVRAFHLGAVVDPAQSIPEFVEDNAHPGYVLGVGNAPDFIITSVKGPTSLEHGQPLTARVTVCNQGTRIHDSRVALLLSEDEHLRLPSPSAPPEDQVVGDAPVPPLAPGQCATVSISGNAYPPPPSTPDVRAFHLGAVLDPNYFPDELRTDNNTHPGYVLGVGYAPDFVITSVTGPASVESGQFLTARVTVCNQGTRPSDNHVFLVLSADENIRLPSSSAPPEDLPVGDAPVPPLAPGQCSTVSISGNIYPPPPSTPDPRTFHLGAVLDPNYPSELRKDNNTHPGYVLGVGYAPDFVITSVKGPASVESGQPLTAQVTVCNQGTRTRDTSVALVLSEDENFRGPSPSTPAEDVFVGGTSVQPLSPGQCSTVSISGNIYPPNPSTPDVRAFHLGAMLNPNDPSELRTDNNTHPGYLLGVGYAPDFVITSVKGPPSVDFGQPLTAQVTVCNQGTRTRDTSVALMLSEDENFRGPSPSAPPEDVFVGGTSVPPLAPGQCTTVSITSSGVYPPPMASPDTRAFHLGAMLNPNDPSELRTDNNTHPGYVLGLGNAPDFVITSVKGPPSVDFGQPLTAQVTVCNHGTRSANPRVFLLLSEDEHLHLPSPSAPPEDQIVGDSLAPPLAPGQCATLSIGANSIYPPNPSTPDTRVFHLGAMVDPRYFPDELRTDNNTHPGYLLGLGHDADFVITSVKGPASVDFGQPLTAQVTVCNHGTRLDYSRVFLVLSQDGNIRLPSPSTPPEDQIVGDAPVPPLAPGQCTTVSIASSGIYPPPMSPPDARAFHLGAVVDPNYFPNELRTDNNTHPGYVLGLGYAPDFVISSVKGPASVDFGQPLTAQVTVCNQGTRSEGTQVALVLSEDEHPRLPSPSGPSDDVLVGNAPVPPLAPSQCTTVSIASSGIYPPPMSPPNVRAFHLGAVVDANAPPNELIEDNNTHPGYVLGLGNAPDFVISSVKGPASVDFGQPLTAQVTVCNQGIRSEGTRVLLALSEDEHLRLPSPSAPPEDQLVGNTQVPPLAPNQCATVSITSSGIYPPPMSSPETRAFHLGAMVDPYAAPDELRTDNNTHPGYLLGVGNAPDFVISSVTGPASVEPGQPFTAQVTVCNQGTRPSDSRVLLVLSEDENLRPLTSSAPPEDTLVGDVPVPPTAPGQCATVSIAGNAYPPPPSTPDARAFHLGAVVDPYAAPDELRTDNNTHPGYLLGVGHDADFVITSVESPVFVRSGQSLATRVNVCNQGTLAASTRVSVLLSTDTTLRPASPSAPSEDVIVGEAQTGLLQPGWCETVSITGNAMPPPSSNPDTQGLAYVGAAVNVNQMNPELRVDNNTLLGGWLYIAP